MICCCNKFVKSRCLVYLQNMYFHLFVKTVKPAILISSPFFLHFAVKLKRKIKICSFRPRQIYLEYLGAIKMRDKDEISI